MRATFPPSENPVIGTAFLSLRPLRFLFPIDTIATIQWETEEKLLFDTIRIRIVPQLHSHASKEESNAEAPLSELTGHILWVSIEMEVEQTKGIDLITIQYRFTPTKNVTSAVCHEKSFQLLITDQLIEFWGTSGLEIHFYRLIHPVPAVVLEPRGNPRLESDCKALLDVCNEQKDWIKSIESRANELHAITESKWTQSQAEICAQSKQLQLDKENLLQLSELVHHRLEQNDTPNSSKLGGSNEKLIEYLEHQNNLSQSERKEWMERFQTVGEDLLQKIIAREKSLQSQQLVPRNTVSSRMCSLQ